MPIPEFFVRLGLAICDFHESVFCKTTLRLTTFYEKRITSPTSEILSKFKAFICLTAWLDPIINALVFLGFNRRKFKFDHVEIYFAAAVIAAKPSLSCSRVT